MMLPFLQYRGSQPGLFYDLSASRQRRRGSALSRKRDLRLPPLISREKDSGLPPGTSEKAASPSKV